MGNRPLPDFANRVTLANQPGRTKPVIVVRISLLKLYGL